MSGSEMSEATAPASSACSRCGAAFSCNPAGDCWCKEEPDRLPMPSANEKGAACVCPSCFRALAADAALKA
jgi:hypothetical protein